LYVLSKFSLYNFERLAAEGGQAKPELGNATSSNWWFLFLQNFRSKAMVVGNKNKKGLKIFLFPSQQALTSKIPPTIL